ncbi:hypothetical protein [Roseovarius tolerans]|uniref:hypothetical protein n=1 Tax=Roseovarius tolerans TaxID=74031 RepID=UPI000941DDF2|nr:hypothetical protein [Roseovarius tolerans]
MSDVTSPFTVARRRLRWANEAIDEFGTDAQTFLQDNPNAGFVTEDDPTTGHKIYKFVFTDDIPDHIFRKATEVVELSKRVFDQSVYAACVAAGANVRSKDNTNFPWAETREVVIEHRLSGRGRERIPEPIKSAIIGLKPYGVGEDCTSDDRISSQISSISNRGHTVGLSMAITVNGGAYIANATVGPGEDFMAGPPEWDPVKKEAEIFRVSPKVFSEMQANTYVKLDICFDEAGALKDLPFVHGMRVFTAKAEAVIQALEEKISAMRG